MVTCPFCMSHHFKHFPKNDFRLFQPVRVSKAEDNFKFDENGRKVSKKIEKTCTADMQNQSLFGKGLTFDILSNFKVNILCNNRDISECQIFLQNGAASNVRVPGQG